MGILHSALFPTRSRSQNGEHSCSETSPSPCHKRSASGYPGDVVAPWNRERQLWDSKATDLKQFLLVVGASILLTAGWEGVRRVIPSSVDYRGEKIKLSKFYLDYDDYKNDPHNIDASETERVQRMVSEAPIAHSFASRKDAVNAVFEVRFPGYGVGGFGDSIQKGEGALNGFEVEIPRAGKSRYFIFRNVHGRYVLVDDFIDPGTAAIQSVREEHGTLVYRTTTCATAFVRAILDSK